MLHVLYLFIYLFFLVCWVSSVGFLYTMSELFKKFGLDTKKFEGGRISLEFKKVWNFLCKGITDVVLDKIKKQWYYFEGVYPEKLIPIQLAMDGQCFAPMCGNIQDSVGFWTPHSGFRILGIRFQPLSVELGFWISIVSGSPQSLSCIPDSKARIRIPEAKILDY